MTANLQLWALSLTIGAVVIVVVAFLLGVIIAAAKSVDRHAAAIWTSGKQIAGNTAAIWMLDRTNDALTRIHRDAAALAGIAERLDKTLGALAGSDRS